MHDEIAIFKALADPTRFRLAVLLSIQGEKCVCQLGEALHEPEFKISRHLGIMRAAGMVEVRRDGTWRHYRLVEPRHHLEACLQACFRNNLADDETVKGDLERLAMAAPCKY